MARIDLPDGQWVELRERITHATDKHLSKLAARGRQDPTLLFDWDTLAARIFVESWHVLDLEGNPIEITVTTDPATRVTMAGPEEAFDRAPAAIIDQIAIAAALAIKAATVPNPPTPGSSDGSTSG